MGRFESSSQIAMLFVVASLVSIGIIYFVKAEQQSRIKRSYESGTVVHVDFAKADQPPTFLSSIHSGFTKVFQFFQNASSGSGARVKRGNEFGDSSIFHRIRHALKKLDGGGLEEDVVYRMMLDSAPVQKELTERNKAHEVEPRNFDVPVDLQPIIQSQAIFPDEPGFEVEYPQTVDHEESLEQTQPLTVSMLPQTQENSTEAKLIPSEPSKVTRTPASANVCYRTDDVLVVIGITCGLNFAFVILIWSCVRCCSNTQRKDLERCGDGKGNGADEDGDDYWISTNRKHEKGEIKEGSSNPNQTSLTTSLYSIKHHSVDTMQRAHSYSMEDLSYALTT